MPIADPTHMVTATPTTAQPENALWPRGHWVLSENAEDTKLGVYTRPPRFHSAYYEEPANSHFCDFSFLLDFEKMTIWDNREGKNHSVWHSTPNGGWREFIYAIDTLTIVGLE